jgi:predicted acetyltransferase
MKNKLALPRLIKASFADYPVVQNLARFYVYDMSRYCGFISEDWACPPNGLFESFDFKCYFSQAHKHAFLVKIQGELAGFVLIKKIGSGALSYYKIGEFFIIAKFQGCGVAEQVAHQIWREYAGPWELNVIPENKKALNFWRKSIKSFTAGKYTEELVLVDHDKHQPYRYLFSFAA